MKTSRAWLALLLCGLSGAAAAPLCDESSVLTMLGTDTASDRVLFALSGSDAEVGGWLVIVDAREARAVLLPDALRDLRTGAFHGDGPFLAATNCGRDCFQPVRLSAAGWEPIGGPVKHASTAAVHLTYDGSGAPWISLHSRGQRAGLVDVTALRWSGDSWVEGGRLIVHAVGSPAAAPDPANDDAILVGTGRFRAGVEPEHWVPALPIAAGSPGGQVVATAGAAVYLTFDSRLFTSLDGGRTWFADAWRPWPDAADPPAGVDYWIDLYGSTRERPLATLWYDERDPARPDLYLARWRSGGGWDRPDRIELASTAMPVEHIVDTASGKWLLIGRCRGGSRLHLEALVVPPGATTRTRPTRLPVETGWLP